MQPEIHNNYHKNDLVEIAPSMTLGKIIEPSRNNYWFVKEVQTESGNAGFERYHIVRFSELRDCRVTRPELTIPF